MPINERTLEHGDQIKIGDSLLVLLLEDGEDSKPSNVVELDEADLGARSTVRLRVEDALYLNSERVLAQLPESQRMTRDLNALLNISTAVNSIRDVEPLKQRLLELLFEVIPAEFGAIVLAADDGVDLNSIFALRRQADPAQPLHVSGTVVRRVLRERVAILSSDVADNADFGGAQSLVASETRSLLCVPLTLFDRVLGVLYLSAPAIGRRASTKIICSLRQPLLRLPQSPSKTRAGRSGCKMKTCCSKTRFSSNKTLLAIAHAYEASTSSSPELRRPIPRF